MKSKSKFTCAVLLLTVMFLSFQSVGFSQKKEKRITKVEGYVFDAKYRFNLLNNATVALDRYVSIMAEHHFNGLILNQVPLIRNLNIRTVVSLKYFIGDLSNKHQDVIKYPWDMRVPDNHYLEVGLGVENILQLIRIEAIWRPVPKYYSGMLRFGVRIRFELSMKIGNKQLFSMPALRFIPLLFLQFTQF